MKSCTKPPIRASSHPAPPRKALAIPAAPWPITFATAIRIPAIYTPTAVFPFLSSSSSSRPLVSLLRMLSARVMLKRARPTPTAICTIASSTLTIASIHAAVVGSPNTR
ncbi:MAG: hypothetical protein QXR14_00600 [Sulfolobales archaeon]